MGRGERKESERGSGGVKGSRFQWNVGGVWFAEGGWLCGHCQRSSNAVGTRKELMRIEC